MYSSSLVALDISIAFIFSIIYALVKRSPWRDNIKSAFVAKVAKSVGAVPNGDSFDTEGLSKSKRAMIPFARLFDYFFWDFIQLLIYSFVIDIVNYNVVGDPIKLLSDFIAVMIVSVVCWIIYFCVTVKKSDSDASQFIQILRS